MKNISKGLIILFCIISIIQTKWIDYMDITIMLLIISTTVLIDGINKMGRVVVLLIETILVGYAFVMGGFSCLILCILLFDAIYIQLPILVISIPVFILFKLDSLITLPIAYWLSFFLAGIVAYLLRKEETKQNYYNEILDNERRMRYDLEITKNELILSNETIEKLTEAKERNRIARDLHDTIGHSMAGILIQLQAVQRVIRKDSQKTEVIIDRCVKNLQSSLGTIRDTVHNMYHTEKLGIDYIKKIVKEYTYCKVEFQYNGDFSKCSTKHLETFTYILKEALTNASKYSEATQIYIELTLNEKLIRLAIKDNGIGCQVIKEGLGLRSMKDRIRNIGGTIAIDGSHGMIIVCTIPQYEERCNEDSSS